MARAEVTGLLPRPVGTAGKQSKGRPVEGPCGQRCHPRSRARAAQARLEGCWGAGTSSGTQRCLLMSRELTSLGARRPRFRSQLPDFPATAPRVCVILKLPCLGFRVSGVGTATLVPWETDSVHEQELLVGDRRS